MRFLTFLLLVAACALAQTQGNLPTIIEGNTIGGNNSCGTWCVPFNENVATGDVLVACMAQESAGGTPPYSVTDTLGNTWTNAGSTNTTSNTTYVQLSYTQSASSGSDQVTAGLNNGGFIGIVSISRYSHITGTSDTVATATSPIASGLQTMTTTNTTTVNGDLLVSCGTTNHASSGQISLSADLQYGVQDASINGFNVITGFKQAGLAGANTASMNLVGGNSSQQSAMVTAAFKPSGIAIIDTALPDGANGVGYSATLHGVGGAGAYTCSITAGSLQTGLALSGAGNCSITGTPSATGLNSITFKITDGTINSTKTLNLNVGGSFNTPAVLQSKTFNGNNGSGTVTLTGAHCGDMVLVFAPGVDTHGGEGWVQTANGTNNSISDTFSSPVSRLVVPAAGTRRKPLVSYLVGPLPISGTDAITLKNSVTASSALPPAIAIEASGVQSVVDNGTFATATTTASGTVAQSYTTVVPNELLLVGADSDTPGDTLSIAAPFSVLATGNDGAYNSALYGDDLVASASTVTATTTVTTTGNTNAWTTALVALRPALPVASCANFQGLGEKHRRQVY